MRYFLRQAMLAAMVLSLGSAWADEQQAVRQVIEGTTGKVISILRDAALKGGAKREERRAKMRETLLSVTDARRVALLTLGRQRSKFTESQLQEFTDVFSQLVFVTYITNIEKYTDEKVNILSVEMLPDSKACVTTKIASSSLETAADFSLFKDEKGGWKIYDVKVEGVSLVSNYRSQFSELLVNQSPEQLIADLKKKVRENEQAA
jgi:phospholipid transport system substrate-binding protein